MRYNSSKPAKDSCGYTFTDKRLIPKHEIMKKLQGIILVLVLIRLLVFLNFDLLDYPESKFLTLFKSNGSRPGVDQNSSIGEPLILLLTKWSTAQCWDYKWIDGNETSWHILDDCPHRCRFSMNQYSYKNTADMVIIDACHYSRKDLLSQKILENQKRTGQIWAGITRESPHCHGKCWAEVDDIYHWMATYRRDGDIFWPYATYTNRTLSLKASEKAPTEKSEQSEKKRKLAAWLVSYCLTPSKREVLVETLRRYNPVDVYGWCREPCPAGLDCRAYIAANYKFYLAFENSLRTDYMTEKLFYMLKQSDPIVPVTFSWINDSTLAPPNSYIDARDIKSIKELADYLKCLGNNDDAYRHYRKWRSDFELVLHTDDNKLCQACEMFLKYKEQLAQDGERLKRLPSILSRHNSLEKGENFSYFKIAGNSIRMTKVCFNPFRNNVSRNWLIGAL